MLHQKSNFIGSINRQYDSSFAKKGAKIGDTLKIRLPNQYEVFTGRVMTAQETAEQSVSLQVATQKGVGMYFDNDDLALSLDDFSTRIIDPAMSVLAAHLEADAMSMYQQVYNEVSDVGATATSALVLGVSKKLTDNLAPTSQRTLNMSTQVNVDLVDALKGLFNPNANISSGYKEGMVANNFLGFESVMQNTLWPQHTTGTDDGTGDYLTDIAAAEANGSAGLLHIDTGAGTFKAGDIIFVTDTYRVHPETKQSTGQLQQFVVTADFPGGEGDLSISPNIVTSGPRQNVDAIANNKAILKVESDGSTAIGASADYGISMGYHRDAFAFVTADLPVHSGLDFSQRATQDGISLRLQRDYDIVNDRDYVRCDVLYGYKAIRPELACRLGLH